MPSMKKRCNSGSRRCGSSCVVTRGKERIKSRCAKGSRRCPPKTGTCKTKKDMTMKKRRKRRYGRY
jgi:hypothetical protein